MRQDQPYPGSKFTGAKLHAQCLPCSLAFTNTGLCADTPRHSDRSGCACATHRERLVDRRQDLARRQFIEASAVALQMALATKLAAWHARQRILHDPAVAAPLNGSA